MKVLCDLTKSGDDSQELEDDIKAIREALVKERQVLFGEYFGEKADMSVQLVSASITSSHC